MTFKLSKRSMIRESYRQKSDAELVKSSLEGDKQAFGDIVKR